MDPELRRLRAEAERLARGKPRSQVRYPDGFCRTAVAVARRRLRPGGSVTRLARELGVSEPTLTKWLRPPAPPVLRPVAVTSAPTPERPRRAGPRAHHPPRRARHGAGRRRPRRRAAGARMIGSTRQVTVWAYGAPADLRKGFDGLSGLVTELLSWRATARVTTGQPATGGRVVGRRRLQPATPETRCCRRQRQTIPKLTRQIFITYPPPVDTCHEVSRAGGPP
jgi:hypothetical protein